MVLWSRGKLGPSDWGLHLWAKNPASSPETTGGHTSSGRGNIQSDRERDELTYTLGNPEHPGRTRGKGVVPWKYGFRDYPESYRSRQRRKNDEREHLRRLEEWLMLHDQRLEEEVQRQVAIAMS